MSASMAATAAPVRPMPSANPSSESRIDRDSHFNGLYETKQNLRIEGLAEGEILCDGTVTVAEGARVKAKVTASTVIIAGEMAGEVLCRDVFQIMPSGQVEATVSARRLVVQEGGFYNGEFHMITDGQIAADLPRPDFRRAKPSENSGDTPAKPSDFGSDEWWDKIIGGGPAAKGQAPEASEATGPEVKGPEPKGNDKQKS